MDKTTKKIPKKPKNKSGKNFSRFLCEFFTDVFGELKKHGINKHGFKRKYCPCSQCSYVEKGSPYVLKTHFVAVHGGLKFSCDQCSKMFSASGLSKHINSVHKKNEFLCQFCDFKSLSQPVLKHHIEFKHEGIRYYCDQCPFSAASNGSLTVHSEVKHLKSKIYNSSGTKLANVRQFHCDQCVFTASCNANLKEHILIKHEGKRYHCEQCDLKFQYLQGLSGHIEGVQKNVCPV